MRIEDPNPTPDPTPDPAAAAAAEAPEVITPEPAVDADVAAFDAGLKEADEAPVEAAVDTPVVPDADPTPDPDKPVDPPADEAKPSDAFGDLPTDAKADTRERFAKLREGYDELHAKADPVLKLLDEAKVTAEQLPEVIQRAERLEEWHGIIEDTGANPEQLTDAFNVLKAINSDDPQVLSAVYDKLTEELALIGKRIGREAPGYDPLAEHDDLREAVGRGDTTRAHALEVAQARAAAKTVEQRTQQVTQQQTAAQVQQQAINDVSALNARLKAADPDFARKVPYLAPAIATIRASLPPEKWAAAIEHAYQQLPALPAEPKPQPKPSGMPIRPTGAPAMQHKPKNDVEAFDMGVASLR